MNAGDILCSTSPFCWVPKVGAQTVAKGAFTDAAQSFFAGFDGLMKDFLTSWVGQGLLVDLDGGTTEWFKSALVSINITLITIGLIIGGARTAYYSRAEPGREVLQRLGRTLFITTAGTTAVQILLAGGDAFSKWILAAAGTDALTGGLTAAFVEESPGLALILGCIGVMIVTCQWGIMIVRGAILPLLNAFWPTAASAAMLDGGEQGFKKITAWILAFIIYSPLAAAIYAFAWRAKNGDDGVGGVIASIVLVALAILALPALMRILVPVAGALGNMVGGAMAISFVSSAISTGVAIGAAVATGGLGAAGAGAGAGAAAETGVATGGEAATGGEQFPKLFNSAEPATGTDDEDSKHGGAGEPSDAGSTLSNAAGASGDEIDSAAESINGSSTSGADSTAETESAPEAASGSDSAAGSDGGAGTSDGAPVTAPPSGAAAEANASPAAGAGSSGGGISPGLANAASSAASAATKPLDDAPELASGAVEGSSDD